MQLCYSENAVNYLKKYWAMGAASHVDLGAEGDVRPPATMQQHYTCIITNDWLVGLQLFFFFFQIRIVEGQNNAECQCEENDRNI